MFDDAAELVSAPPLSFPTSDPDELPSGPGEGGEECRHRWNDDVWKKLHPYKEDATLTLFNNIVEELEDKRDDDGDIIKEAEEGPVFSLELEGNLPTMQ